MLLLPGLLLFTMGESKLIGWLPQHISLSCELPFSRTVTIGQEKAHAQTNSSEHHGYQEGHTTAESVTPSAACSQVKHVIEEEWSYIPVGGPLPLGDQPVTAFGAAANLVHPATGYSIARSLREAPALAAEMAVILCKDLPVQETARQVWNALWPAEKRRQVCKLTPSLIWMKELGKTSAPCPLSWTRPMWSNWQ